MEQLRLAEVKLAVFEGRYEDVLEIREELDAALGTETGILAASLLLRGHGRQRKCPRRHGPGQASVAAAATVPHV